MLPFAFASFLGAFLLFSVQPLLGRYVLPWFGGSPAVWNVCLVFFQTSLLGGYLYAHLLVRLCSPRRQVVIHGVLLVLTVALLPPIPTLPSAAGQTDWVAWRVLGLLAKTIGLPFVILAATGPIIQSWFGQRFPHLSPYRLFAVSNAGSLLGLISYPILIEPYWGRATQALGWSAGFLAFAALLIRAGFRPIPPVPLQLPAEQEQAKTRGHLRWDWIGRAALGSALLVATTATLTHDIAAVPFLWIGPLAVYLVSFIVAFDHPRWYHRPTLSAALVVAVIIMIDAKNAAGFASFTQLFSAYLAALLIGGLICHGELYHTRPATRHLTHFYLHIAAGGALGSLSVALFAPILFDHFYDLPLLWTAVLSWFCFDIVRSRNLNLARYLGLGVLIAPLFLVLFRSIDGLLAGINGGTELWHDSSQTIDRTMWLPLLGVGTGLVLGLGDFRRGIVRKWHPRVALLPILITLGLTIGWWKYGIIRDPASIYVSRNIHGVVSVSDYHRDSPRAHSRYLSHGTTTHGIQLMYSEFRSWPTTYYGPASGVGLALALPHQTPNREIGVIGLGVGTVACYGQKGDTLRFYELDAAVVEIARSMFTMLNRSPAKIDVKVGDGRLLIETETHDRDLAPLDLLIVDAFNSDAVPVHLLTREAFLTYLDRLAPRGIIAANVSNRLIDLSTVVRALAHDLQLTAATIYHSPDEEDWWSFPSEWVLLTRDPAVLAAPGIAAVARAEIPPANPTAIWTDDNASLWPLLR